MRSLTPASLALALVACSSSTPGEPAAGSSGTSSAAGTSAGAPTAPSGGVSGVSGAGASAAGTAAKPAGTGGAGARAAGAGGAGAGGAGAGGSAPAAACSGAFCEDFESGQLSTQVWTKQELSSGNTAAVQTSKAAHGKYALQLHAKGGSRNSMVFLENLPVALQKHYFGRIYFYLTGVPTESGGHTAFITSSNTLKGFPDADHHLEVASYAGGSGAKWQMTYWQGDGPESIGSGGNIPMNKWFCLEWEFNDAPNEIAVWVDGDGMTNGAAFRNISNHSSNLLGKLTTLGLGFRTWHPMGAPDVDVYVDDVALGTERVGCLQ